jgi:hypothetical protein
MSAIHTKTRFCHRCLDSIIFFWHVVLYKSPHIIHLAIDKLGNTKSQVTKLIRKTLYHRTRYVRSTLNQNQNQIQKYYSLYYINRSILRKQQTNIYNIQYTTLNFISQNNAKNKIYFITLN